MLMLFTVTSRGLRICSLQECRVPLAVKAMRLPRTELPGDGVDGQQPIEPLVLDHGPLRLIALLVPVVEQ